MVKWTSHLPEFSRKLAASVDAIRKDVAALAHDSIVSGSHATGSPGQPHDLREGQWTVAETGPDTTTVGTSDPSARSVEDGISHKYGGPITLKSPIGGFHSVKLTHQNIGPLVKKAVDDVRRKR